ncbi:CHAT domain-containing protein [Suillus subluteus]|nr:CHAT domain-containing protein [Suillus subluteus]
MEVLALRPVGHTDRSVSLNNLATQLSCHFEHRGNEEDLDRAIALQREVLALRLVGHPDRSSSLNNFAFQLSSHFEHQGNDEDLDQAIALHREALALHPSLNNLAFQLSAHLDQVLALLPVSHTDRSLSLNNLANQLFSCFEHQGNEEDLDWAIALQREALALCPHQGNDEDLDQAIALYREALALRPEDLDRAIALQREALALHPVGHTDRSGSLNNLANQLSSRFEHRGNDEDLDQAIALQREALALHPVSHTDQSKSLNNLAIRLSSCFEHQGNDEDLDQAIALQREVLALHPVSHIDWSLSLNNLAIRLSSLFEEALALRPVSHPDRSLSLNNLANQLSSCFEHQGNREDLNKSQENLHSVVYNSLAKVYLSFHHSGLDGTRVGEDTDSLNSAMHHLKATVNVVSGGLLSCLRASLYWVHHATSQHPHATELEAYVTSMHLLDAYMSMTASVSSRHNIMKDFPRMLAVDAALCALRSGDVCRAVELLEQGRTIIWTQMTRLRTPLDNLQTCSDHAAALMKKFRDPSSLLNKPPANDQEATPRVDVEAEETRYRHLVKDWNGAVEEIQKIKGFSRFLLPPLFSDLQDAARDGPIIMLIASKSSCDAIFIPHKQPPTKIPLPTNLEKLWALVAGFQYRSTPALTTALAELWDDVVCLYWKDGQFLSQFYISSYTPSLTALIKACRHDRSLSVSFAAIGQNCPAGASFTLDCVEPELELVRSLLPPPPTVSFTKITSIDAMKLRALPALQENTWLHFLCHGTQKYEDPFNSAFLMRDQPLSLLNITQTDLSQHEFTFLSACDTAVGDHDTPDEVIHLAASLQFTGVKSVVGTLWKVNDSTVQCLVEAFYKNLCRDGKMNSKRAARALHKAVQLLACNKDMPLEQRIVFVHIGI